MPPRSRAVMEGRAGMGEPVSAIEALVKAMEDISQITASMASAVEEQTAATSEIARNVEQAANGIKQVFSNIAGVHEAATNSSGTAGEMVAVVAELSQQVETLRNELDGFLANLRAA